MIMSIKLLIICIVACLEIGFTYSIKLPHGFNHKDTAKFHGFDALHFDGKHLNPFDYDINDVLQRFAKKHNRKYSDSEIQLRKNNLKQSLEVIQQHIIDSINTTTYNLGLTSLSDLTNEEFQRLSGSVPRPPVAETNRSKRSEELELHCQPKTDNPPQASLDWRKKNIVTHIKNQDHCSSCWAHASVACIESAWAMKTDKHINLSEQDLINCASAHGCDGENIHKAYMFVIKSGISQESELPYKGVEHVCKHYPLSKGVEINDFCGFSAEEHWSKKHPNGVRIKDRNSISDEMMMKYIRDYGPISAHLNGDNTKIQHYVSGIFNWTDCPKNTNHAIQIVGWDSENGVHYWIVKNSWGTQWGESGFFRIARSHDLCGINSYFEYPILYNTEYINKINF